MKSNNIFRFLRVLFILLTAGCGGGGGGGGGGNPPAPTLVSIAVTPANSSLAVGTSGQFTATGTFSDNSTQDLTSSASWSSSATTIATVSNDTGSKGTVVAVAAGAAIITASVGTVTGTTNLTLTDAAVQPNVMAITVNGSLCSAGSYLNKPCVSVTVCNPDLSVCQTVNDILLDTGSYGLRIFQQTIPTLTLPQVASGTGSLTGCVQFADGSSLWGPIRRAAVKLGDEPAVQVPVQVIDSTFGSLPLPCANADPSPVSSGFAGILGVGPLIEDCGTGCVIAAANGVYFRCSGTSCVGTTVALADQVQNPVARLPLDNNGLLVQLPSVPIGGVPTLAGSLILGIGTRANNATATPTVFPTDGNGDIRTRYSGLTTVGFFDTGSNGLFFPDVDDPALPVCASPNADWYCPAVTRALLATNVGIPAAPTQDVAFNVSNFLTLVNSTNNVFSDIGGPSTFGFDWGLPFFMGRSVYFGIEGIPSGLGTGPYVAY